MHIGNLNAAARLKEQLDDTLRSYALAKVTADQRQDGATVAVTDSERRVMHLPAHVAAELFSAHARRLLDQLDELDVDFPRMETMLAEAVEERLADL